MKNILIFSIILCNFYSILTASSISNITPSNENSKIEELEYANIIEGTLELLGDSTGKARLDLEDNTMKITKTGLIRTNEYSVINIKNGSLYIEGTLDFEKEDKDSSEKMVINLGENAFLTIACAKQINDLFAQINIDGGKLNIIQSDLSIMTDINVNNNGQIYIDESLFNLEPETNFNIKKGKLDILSSSISIGPQSNVFLSKKSIIQVNNSKINNRGRLDSSTKQMSLCDNSQLNIIEEKFVMRNSSKLMLKKGASINLSSEGKSFINEGSEIVLTDNTYLRINYGGLFVLDDAKIVKGTKYDKQDKGGNISIVGCNIDPSNSNEKVLPALFLRKTSEDNYAQIKCNKLDLGLNPKVLRGDDNTSVEISTFVTGTSS